MFNLIPAHKQTRSFSCFIGAKRYRFRMSLDAGGHLTHGAKPNFSGKVYNSVHGLNNETELGRSLSHWHLNINPK